MEDFEKNGVVLEKFSENEDWNELIFSMPVFHYLQTREWGEFKEKQGWKPMRFKITNGKKEIIGAAQFLAKKTFLLKNIIYCPRGPLVKEGVADKPNFWIELKKELGRMAKTNNGFLVKTEPHLAKKETLLNSIKGAGFVSARPVQLTNCTIINDLTLDEKEILKRMRKNARYYIRLAEKNGVEITEDNSSAAMENFLRLYCAASERAGVFFRRRAYISELLNFFIQAGRAKIFLAEYEKNFLAGAVVFIFQNRAWYVYGGSTRDHKEITPSYLLQFAIMKKLKVLGVKYYDLGGVPCLGQEEQNFMAGLYTFKSHFGGDYKEFAGSFDAPVKKIYCQIWKKTERLVKKCCKIFKKDLFY